MMNNSKQPKIVGFAGHRHVRDREGLAQVLEKDLMALKAEINGSMIAMSSAAAGADLLFLQKCVELRIPTIVILPFPEKRFSEDFENGEEWAMMERLTSVALAKYISPNGLQAPAAYQAVSRDLVEWADAFLFAWDGAPAKGPGGTGETVEEARDLGIPTRIIDPGSLEAKWTLPLDPARRARHGFETRSELLDFLDLKFAVK